MESLNVEPLSEMALIRFENSSHKVLYKAVGLDKLLKGLWRFHIYSSGSAAKVRLKLIRRVNLLLENLVLAHTILLL
jgi:hypothetical protein